MSQARNLPGWVSLEPRDDAADRTFRDLLLDGASTPFPTGDCIDGDVANCNGVYDYNRCGARGP